MHRGQYKAALVVVVLSLAGCSGPSTSPTGGAKTAPEKEAAAALAPVTAKTAFWEIYKSSYKWAPDSLPLSIEAKTIPGIQNEGGKAAAWEVNFGSFRKMEARKFTYAITAHPPDFVKGVAVGGPIPWHGPVKDALTFQSTEFLVDSDVAYKTALEKAQPWLKDHPGKELTTISLGAASRFPGPVWYFLWGNTKSGYFTLISANSGKPLGK
jgi:hypothetical protein